MSPAPVISEDETSASPYGTKWTRWIRPIGLSLLLVLIDAPGIFTLLVGTFLILVYLPRSFLARRYAPCRKERLIRFGIYLAAVGVALSLIPINRQIGEERANRIITAVEAYKAANGTYPERLDQLVPRFISEIPDKARISYLDIGFRYYANTDPEAHKLLYLATPSFGRRTYSFETKSWGYMD